MKTLTRAGFAVLVALSLTSIAQAQSKDWWIVRPGGERVEGFRITADDRGNLTIDLDQSGNIKTTVRWGEYVSVRTPKPTAIAQLEQQVARGQHAWVIENAPKLFATSLRFLGWADEIQTALGNSYLAQAQFSNAEKAFQEGLKLTFDNDAKAPLVRGLIEAYIGLNTFDKVGDLISQLSVRDPRMAAYRFSVQGRLAEQKGDKQGAVLNHLKVIMLYGKDVGDVRKNSYEHVIRLMKSMNDRRYLDFERELKQEYG